MTYGVFVGAALIIYSFIIYLLGIDLYSPVAEYKYLSYITYVIINLDYIRWYNTERIHSSIDYLTPLEMEVKIRKNQILKRVKNLKRKNLPKRKQLKRRRRKRRNEQERRNLLR